MRNRKRQTDHKIEPKVALCYIRQSYTRDDDDMNSPERQRSNIESICERHGWIPEWYQDVGGHKSGRYENNRPAWLKLKDRLGDVDVTALVANDLSRLHRNVARISTLIERLEDHSITLILAASDIVIDTSTIMGQMFAQFSGLMDAYYAKDISAKAKDSIAYRKRQGKTVGIPPFGTTRNDEGYLIPSPDGAWLLPDGRFSDGSPDEPPNNDAVWRSYCQCAERILTIYAENQMGLERIAYTMNTEGWAFRDRWGNPRPINRSDVLRVVANWGEYGGIVSKRRSKDRPAYEPYDPDELLFKQERAVFPIELLRTVAAVRQQRTIRPNNDGINVETHPYILNGITYCSHCDTLAEKHKNPKLRSRLGGSRSRNFKRYRHKAGVKCGVTNRSVHCEELDADFARLIKLLTVKPEAVDMMMELAALADRANGLVDDIDPEEERRKAIALRKRRIEALTDLYANGRMGKEKYWKQVDKNEREIAHWETWTTETQKAAAHLAMCMDLVCNIAEAWETTDNEERKSLAETFFSEIVYDLDTRRIVRFKLKPIFDRYLRLSADLYDYQAADKTSDSEFVASQQGIASRPLGGIPL